MRRGSGRRLFLKQQKLRFAFDPHASGEKRDGVELRQRAPGFHEGVAVEDVRRGKFRPAS